MKECIIATATIALASCVTARNVTEEQTAVTATADMSYYCAPQETQTPICGFEYPEDAEWLPDGSGLIVSEYGQYALESRISLLNIDTGEITVLYDASMAAPETALNEWGAQGVTQKEQFSPHGISLSQRSDGRWQLLVVNHARQETVDFFELIETGDTWSLHWRGGVDANDDSKFNDVAAAGNGFFTTRFFRGSRDQVAIDYIEGRENGVVKTWQPDQGWKDLEGTQGVALNGILWNQAADELVVAEWGKSRVHVYSGAGQKKYSINDISHPDNVSWNDNRDAYLVASKSVPIEELVECGASDAEVCSGDFHVYEISPGTGDKSVRYSSNGKFWGPPSNAVERDGKLYLGSFGGTRILVVE